MAPLGSEEHHIAVVVAISLQGHHSSVVKIRTEPQSADQEALPSRHRCTLTVPPVSLPGKLWNGENGNTEMGEKEVAPGTRTKC